MFSGLVERLSTEPGLPNCKPGEWNSSESGHPGVFVDRAGQTWLFFQGNDDKGRTWFLSRAPVSWSNNVPSIPELPTGP